MPRIEAVFVGTELLEGRVNTHAARLAALLSERGWRLAREATTSDDAEEIAAAVADACGRADAVLVFGGLGPTFDDLTREGAAKALGRGLAFKPAILDRIRGKFAAKNLPMARENRRQAFLIDGAKELVNRHGSAPGQLLSFGPGKTLALFPGPLHEMEPMLAGRVLPELERKLGRGRVHCAQLRMAGLLESAADERLRPFIRGGLSCTILSGRGLVDFYASSESRAELERFLKKARKALKGHVYGEGETTLPEALGRRLKSERATLALAESCTGGLASKLLTDIPGSSGYFIGGAVAYSNALKVDALGVSEDLLKRHGAVSEECAKAMAEGAKTRFRSTWALSLTGIAGPSGGTRAKPIGLVYIGLAGPAGVRARRFDFSGDRSEIREKSAHLALYWLWKSL